MENIKIKNLKGGNISASIHYPEIKSDELAILCPGYLDSKDYKHLVGLADDLSKQGYTAVRFDPTGTWESDGDISEYITTQTLEDIKSVLEYMLQQADYKHVLVGGHSRGGRLSILYGASDPRVSLVLGIMPSSGPITGKIREEWRKTGFRISQRDLPDNKKKKREYRVPYPHLKNMNQYNVLRDVKKIKVPIVLIAGELDDIILPEDVREIYDNANEPKKFILIKGIGHDYRHSDEEVKIVNRKILEELNSMK